MRSSHALACTAAVALATACGSSGGETSTATTSAAATTGTGGASAAATTGAGGESATASSTSSSSSSSATGTGGGPMTDKDGDGLDDAFEAKVAADYMPFLSLDPADGCALGGMLYRVTPHPNKPGLLWIIYDHLYQNDCGLNGHVGDDEAFGITVDPQKPAPGGILAIKAISHQNTPCQNISECGQCAAEAPCTTQMKGGLAYPVVYSSKDKHGSYAQACTIVNCLDTCTLAATEAPIPMQNAGEPGGHLTEDLTTDGFVTAANGWTEMSLFHFNPWDPMKAFGAAGNIAGDLADMSFVAASCP
jgi:hypothetical protein